MTAYATPRSVADVVKLLSERGDAAKILAGGQSLLVLLRQGLVSPQILVSLRQVTELRELSFSQAEGAIIGVCVTQSQIERDPRIRSSYTALAEAASVVATRQVRNLGTIGGNLCHADPTADPPAALIALGAQLEIAGPSRTRRVAVEAFFTDFMEVDLAPEEVLTRILLPPVQGHSGSAYLKFRLRDVDTALVGAAVGLTLSDKGEIRDSRIGLSAAGSTPVRAVAAEAVLNGSPVSDEVIARAAQAAAASCEPFSDTEASDWYRRQMVRVFVQRSTNQALERARAA